MSTNPFYDQSKVEFKMAICNHCDCELKDECARYDKTMLASYDFEAIKNGGFDCSKKKDNRQI